MVAKYTACGHDGLLSLMSTNVTVRVAVPVCEAPSVTVRRSWSNTRVAEAAGSLSNFSRVRMTPPESMLNLDACVSERKSCNIKVNGQSSIVHYKMHYKLQL